MLRLFFVFLFPVLAFCDTLTIGQAFVDLAVTTATAGSQPDPDIDSSLSYTATWDSAATRNIVASIDQDTPQGSGLVIVVTAPGSGTSLGPIQVTSVPTAVVTGIDTSVAGTGPFSITLSLAADVSVNPTVFSRTVTLEVVAP